MAWYEILLCVFGFLFCLTFIFILPLVSEYKRYKLLCIDWRRFIGLRNSITFVVKSENIERINAIKERYGKTSDEIINDLIENWCE